MYVESCGRGLSYRAFPDNFPEGTEENHGNPIPDNRPPDSDLNTSASENEMRAIIRPR
jgi:hypothetical protein